MIRTETRPDGSIFQTLVVGVDFSPASRIVVKQARALAAELQAHLIFVYALSEPVQLEYPSFENVGPDPLLEKAVISDTKEELAKFYQLEASESRRIKRGTVASVLNEIAIFHHKPLIVIGSSQHGILSHFILGSNAESTALRSHYPVWVHRGERTVAFERILVPIDPSKSADEMIAMMNAWAAKKQLKITFIYVSPEEPSILPRPDFHAAIEKLRKATIPGFEIITAHGDAAEKICEASRDFDLVAMNPHNRSGFRGSIGKVTRAVMHRSPVPVLVLQNGGL